MERIRRMFRSGQPVVPLKDNECDTTRRPELQELIKQEREGARRLDALEELAGILKEQNDGSR